MNINRELIIKTVAEQVDNYGVFGLRAMTDGVVVSVGDDIENSYHWEDGNPTDDMMDGTSTVGLDAYWGEIENLEEAIEILADYAGKEQLVLVAGEHNTSECHNDRGECVIKNAVCVAIVG